MVEEESGVNVRDIELMRLARRAKMIWRSATKRKLGGRAP